MLDKSAIRDESIVDQAMSEEDNRDIAAAKNGDGDAFGRLVRRYQTVIATQMRRFSRDSAICEELVHDVFVEAYISLRGFRGQAPWLHWLRRIAVRVGYRFWTKRKNLREKVSLSDGDWLCLQGRAPPPSDATEAAEQVQAALSRLPPADRLILTLIYLDGCTISEAASRGGWTVAGAKLRAFRARSRLKQVIDRGGS